MSLSEKSDEEISELLAEYGITHGPIVGEKSANSNYSINYVVPVLETDTSSRVKKCCYKWIG